MKKNVSRLYSSLSVVMIHLKIESMGPEARRSTPFSLENLRSLSVWDDEEEEEEDDDDDDEDDDGGAREEGEAGEVSSKAKETEGEEARGEATCGREDEEVAAMEEAKEAAGESRDEKDLEKAGDEARVRYFGPGW